MIWGKHPLHHVDCGRTEMALGRTTAVLTAWYIYYIDSMLIVAARAAVLLLGLFIMYYT